MSFWKWMKETYSTSVKEWVKRRNLNFVMYLIGARGGTIAFAVGLTLIITKNAPLSLLFFCLSGGDFILGNYGWYREHGS